MVEEQQKITTSDGRDLNVIREKLDDVNALIEPYKLAYVNTVSECVPLEKNAHYMDKQVLDHLTENVAHDGFLSQLPFAMKRKDDGKYLILSGNHRLKAAIKAHLEYILILYIDEVDKDTQLGYQLSHNALVGKDDAQMLKEIYKEINSIEMQKFSGLNGINFVDVNKISIPSIGDGDIELTEVKFQFIESRTNSVKNVLKALEELDIDENSSLVYGSFESFIICCQAIKKKYDIKSRSIAFSKMVDICQEYLKLLEDEQAKENKEEK